MTNGNETGQIDERGFWDKVGGLGRRLGRTILKPALVLYYVWVRPETPVWAKVVIAGALTYLVCPIDAIPDVLPVVGYTDDAGVLAAALATVASLIDHEVDRKADAAVESILG